MYSMLENWYQFVCICRYLRLILDLLEFWGYFSCSPQHRNETQATEFGDFTVIITTLAREPKLIHNLNQWLSSTVREIIVVTVDGVGEAVKAELEKMACGRLRLRILPHPSARKQLVEGIKHVKTDLFIISDDRTITSPQTLQRIAVAFSNASVGGVNVSRKVLPRGLRFTMWESFSALNQVRRNILQSALTYFHDGQVLNLSGGFSAYRTCILQNHEFYNYFLDERWLGKYKITTGDDNAFTRWVVQHGWKTRFDNSHEAMIISQAPNQFKYLKQLKRWSRDTARSYLKDLHFAITSGQRHAYVRAILNIVFNYASDALVLSELAYIMACIVSSNIFEQSGVVMGVVLEHFLVAAGFTIFEHLTFFGSVWSLIYIPGTILYMYIHASVVLFSLFTLQKSVWDSR